jgi:hypothetical protein
MISVKMITHEEGVTLPAGRDIPLAGGIQINITDKENFPVV